MKKRRQSKKQSSEPGFYTRRHFLRTTCLGTAASWTLPAFIQQTIGSLEAAAADSALQATTGKDSPILVLVQLAGGNDGLNTLVPYGDDAYHRARPRLAVPAKDVLRLDDYAGFHPALTPLKALYDEGHLAVVQGVGYPNPNRSHFRSTEIWQQATDSDQTARTGWLGRYFDHACRGADPEVGVAIGNQTPQAFDGTGSAGVTFNNPNAFRMVGGPEQSEEYFRSLNSLEGSTMGNEGDSIGMLAGGSTRGRSDDTGALDFLQRVAMDARLSSERILEIARKHPSTAEYPANQLANSLHIVGRMIAGGLSSRIYYVSQGGYDTHAGQLNAHPRLLGELSESLAAFVRDLQAQGNFERVTIMTFSEFGRRVAENANNGTDHGAAAPMLLAGGAVKPGLHGKHPSLTNLDRGDLIHTTDFRSVYATLLQRRLQTDPVPILGRRFPLLDVI